MPTPAPFTEELKRMRTKLVKRLEEMSRKESAGALKEAKEKLYRSLDRRLGKREPVEKETLAQFANGQSVVEESSKVSSLRAKLLEE